jgi:homoserine kinase type II
MGLAWLHEAAADYPHKRPNDLGQANWARMFAPLEGAAERLKLGLSKVIAADIDHFAQHWPKHLPRGTIHADFFPDNVFFRDGKFAAAIDFYFACHAQLAYDIAITLNAWCFEADGSFNVTKARALIAGYESKRPLGADEKALMPLLAHGAAMRFFLTRLDDWSKPADGALVRPHNPMEYERKLAVHRAGLDLFGAA